MSQALTTYSKRGTLLYCVGCDGAHSTVRHELGLEFQGETLMSDWMLADVHLRGVPRPDEVSVVWHADDVLVIFPITDSRYRVIADISLTAKQVSGPRLVYKQ